MAVSEPNAPAVPGLSHDAALRRAEELVLAAHLENARGRWSWEGTAMRDLVALALYATGLRDRTPADETPLGRVLVPLFDQADFEQLVRAELTAAGHRLGAADSAEPADPADPVSVRWAWLHRRWDPDAPIGQRWDGLPRGVARGLPDPAIEICLSWAGGVVDRALAAERGALDRRTRVRIISGEFAGQSGTVETPAWLLTPAGDAVEPGPPAGYMVRLDRPDGIGDVERILAADLEPSP